MGKSPLLASIFQVPEGRLIYIFGIKQSVNSDTDGKMNSEAAASGPDLGNHHSLGDTGSIHDLFRWQQAVQPGFIIVLRFQDSCGLSKMD
jgi:hypothetical protein